MSSYQKPPVWFIILIIAFPQLSETIFAPLLPFITEAFKTTQTLSQMTLSVYFLGFAFGVLFWGRLSDKVGRKRALLLGVFCYCLGSLLLCASNSIYELLFWRVFQAFGAASGSVISQTLLRESFQDEQERASVFSTMSSAIAWTPALGPFLGGQLISFLRMESVFIFLALMGVGIFFCTQKTLKETKRVQQKPASLFSVLARMLKDPKIYLYTFLVAGMNTVIFSIYSESPFVFMNVFKWSPRTYSFIGIGMALFSMLGAKLNKVMVLKAL